jgi:anti-sigma regulatory factor (Ser/Thr protein kinase)
MDGSSGKVIECFYHEDLQGEPMKNARKNAWRMLGEWSIPSAPGNERLALALISEAVQPLGSRVAALETAVSEAVMNAMEHGTQYQPDTSVILQVFAQPTSLMVRVLNRQRSRPIASEIAEPDLEAKLAGLQSPRGWGLFLIRHLVDEMQISEDDQNHVVELVMHLKAPRPSHQSPAEQSKTHARDTSCLQEEP